MKEQLEVPAFINSLIKGGIKALEITSTHRFSEKCECPEICYIHNSGV